MIKEICFVLKWIKEIQKRIKFLFQMSGNILNYLKNIVPETRTIISVYASYNKQLANFYTCPLMAVFEDNCG